MPLYGFNYIYRDFKEIKITSPVFFLAIGFFITISFALIVPAVYDPIIKKALPIEPIDKETLQYFKSIYNQENIMIGIYGYVSQCPRGYCPDYETSSEIIEKGIRILGKQGLDADWLALPDKVYDYRFLNIAEKFGYTAEFYFSQNIAFKSETWEEIAQKNTLQNKTALEEIEQGIEKTGKQIKEIKEEIALLHLEEQIKKIRIEMDKIGQEIMKARQVSLAVLSSNFSDLTKGEIDKVESKIEETKNLLDGFQARLVLLENRKPNQIILKEYTANWGKKDISDIEYSEAKAALEKDTAGNLNSFLVHIQDYNKRTESFIKEAVLGNESIQFIRVDGISSKHDLVKLKELVDLSLKNDKSLLVSVVPDRLLIFSNSKISRAIKTTWFVFVLFFLFPIAVMLPLHWYERGKIRKKERKILNSPKVSLILPAYNEEKFIAKSIEQSLRQDYKGQLEIIIIDDGSTDRTFEIAKQYALSYPNIKVYKHEKNSGKPAALNTGFLKSSAEISVFSDTDSHLDDDLVSRMVPHFDDPKVGMVSGMIVIDNEINMLTKLQQIEYLYNQEIVRFCQATHKGVLICPGAATAVRTKIAQDIPSTERTVTEDSDFTFEVAGADWKVAQEPEAISRTNAPETWNQLIEQRKRWLYGVLQTIWIHKPALFFKGTKVPNLWVWWAWIGYLTCPITTLAVIAMPLFIWLIGPNYLVFLGFYSLLIGIIYGFAHWYGLKQYSRANKQKLIFLLPIYMVYQYILNLLLFYLVLAFISRRGVFVRYGGRDIHAL